MAGDREQYAWVSSGMVTILPMTLSRCWLLAEFVSDQNPKISCRTMNASTKVVQLRATFRDGVEVKNSQRHTDQNIEQLLRRDVPMCQRFKIRFNGYQDIAT